MPNKRKIDEGKKTLILENEDIRNNWRLRLLKAYGYNNTLTVILERTFYYVNTVENRVYELKEEMLYQKY